MEIKSNLEGLQVTNNFNEVKVYIDNELEKYRNIVVTEDNLKDCKSTRATLNKMQKDIDSKRKELKKMVMSEFGKTEDKYKEIVKMIEDVSKPIDEKVKEFENKKREENREYAERYREVRVIEAGLKPEYATNVKILDEFTNLSTTFKKIEKGIEAQIEVQLVKQKADEERKEADKNTIKMTVDIVNERISSKIDIDDYLKMYESGKLIDDVVSTIKRDGNNIYAAEKKAKEEADRKAKEEIEKKELEYKKEACDKKEINIPVDFTQRKEPAVSNDNKENVWECSLRLSGGLKELCDLVKDVNGITSIVEGKYFIDIKVVDEADKLSKVNSVIKSYSDKGINKEILDQHKI